MASWVSHHVAAPAEGGRRMIAVHQLLHSPSHHSRLSAIYPSPATSSLASAARNAMQVPLYIMIVPAPSTDCCCCRVQTPALDMPCYAELTW